MVKTFSKEFIQKNLKEHLLHHHLSKVMLFIYIVLTSMVPTCTPIRHVGNAREHRKGLLPNNRKGLLPNNNTSHSCQNSF